MAADGGLSDEKLALKVLSWNVDGLDDDDIEVRTRAVIGVIKTRLPHIVYLQEVVDESLALFQTELSSLYSVFSQYNPMASSYFSAIFVTKECPQLSSVGDFSVFDFPGSSMGRQLLRLSVSACGIPITLYTAHLESLKDFSKERQSQLQACFQFITEQNSFGRSCIFGGDLNVDDMEIDRAGLPKSFIDVWEACGNVEEHRYTYDTIINDNHTRFVKKWKRRIDRLYLSPSASQDKCFEPVSFELVGKERVGSCQRFPSDHWGIFLVLNLNNVGSQI